MSVTEGKQQSLLTLYNRYIDDKASPITNHNQKIVEVSTVLIMSKAHASIQITEMSQRHTLLLKADHLT